MHPDFPESKRSVRNVDLLRYGRTHCSRAEASTCSLFYPIQPLTSMVLGVLLLNEHMTVGFIAGAVLIVFGVLYSTLGKEKTR